MRAISRVCDVSINTVSKLLVDAGEACLALHDEAVRNVKGSRIQCDEIWSMCCAKEKYLEGAKPPADGAGDVWTWTALDEDTKLIVAYCVGDRSGQSAIALMGDLRARLSNRVQLTTGVHKAYLEAVEGEFCGDVDYAPLVKLYGSRAESAKSSYSTAVYLGARKERFEGNLDITHVPTSHVKRQNLAKRMSMCRFTHLSNAVSKKLGNHIYTLALYFTFYNFIRIHKSLKVTPAMAAGITDQLWGFDDVIAKMEHSN